VRQGLLARRSSGRRQLATVARERGQRHEDRQRQFVGGHRQAEARARRFGLPGEQRRGQRPGHVQQDRRLAATRSADDGQTMAEPEDLVQGDVGFAAGRLRRQQRGGISSSSSRAAGVRPCPAQRSAPARRRDAAASGRAAARRRSRAATRRPPRHPPVRCRAARCSASAPAASAGSRRPAGRCRPCSGRCRRRPGSSG
jgi:hypothetical protein